MMLAHTKKTAGFVVVLCLVFTWGVFASSEPDVPSGSDSDSDVLELTKDTFASAIADHPLIAVEFFSPWCGHCKSLAPEWEKAATEMKGKVPVAKVDCTANQEVCSEQGIQGYPTLKLFREGVPSAIEVARKSEAIVSFLTKELEPAILILSTSAEVESFLETHPLTVIAFLDNNHDDRYTVFNTVAAQKRHLFSFVAVINADWSGHQAPALVLRKNVGEPEVVYAGEFTSEAIPLWIARELLPVLGELNVETYNGYAAALLPLGFLFVDPNDASTTELLKELEPKLAAFKNDFVIAWINNHKFSQQATRFGLSSKIPSLALELPSVGVRFVYPEDQVMTADSLAEWFTQYKKGTLKPFVKSEPVPESNEGPVKVVVAHTYKDIVEDITKDVFVEFYAPWCGHCKSLAPIWEELGSVFSKVPSVVIAKIDSTANDVSPKLNIRGFPTLLFFSSDNKETPVTYSGDRTLEGFAEFIHARASIKFELPSIPKTPVETPAEGKDEL